MLRRPSARRRSAGQAHIELPLVPIMDAFVTLIAFLLMATSLLSVTLIDTPVPILSSLTDPSKEKPLTLTLKISSEGIRIESPFNLIQAVSVPRVADKYDGDKLHDALVGIKQKFPKERKIIFMPSADVKYDDLVQIMDSSRSLLKTDPPLYVQGEGGVNKPETDLFPEVVFGNIVSGT
jgi:biopolymer transport protein ExbD